MVREPELIDINAVIDGEAFGGYQRMVVAVCCLLIMLDTVDLTLISYAAPAIAQEWGFELASLGPVFAAGLIGSMIGSLALGAAADSIGRKLTVLGGVVLFGGFTLLTATAHSYATLVAFRFMTGLGLGGVIPNLVAITSEYSPSRIRPVIISVMASGLPLGSMLAGIMAAAMLPAFGWKSIFYAGGILPLALVPILIWKLPESIRFLALKRYQAPRLARIMRRIAPTREFGDADSYVVCDERVQGFPVIGLVSDGRLATTLLLWVAFLASYLTLFLLASWMPSLLQQAGIPLERAILYTTVFFLGGPAGGVILAWLTKRMNARRLVGCAFIGSSLMIAASGVAHRGSAAVLVIALLLAGFFVFGTQINLYAIAAASYPTAMRSTGVGWASGIGRAGSILGPLVAGTLLSSGSTIVELFWLTAIPGLFASAALIQLSRGNA